MEADLALGFGSDEQLDAEGDERDLDVTGPIGTRQNAPRGQLHQMIEVSGSTVKMYEVVIDEEDKAFCARVFVLQWGSGRKKNPKHA